MDIFVFEVSQKKNTNPTSQLLKQVVMRIMDWDKYSIRLFVSAFLRRSETFVASDTQGWS